jgi:multidrug efflux pump subunit AcrA (membrane-fusion protein)
MTSRRAVKLTTLLVPLAALAGLAIGCNAPQRPAAPESPLTGITLARAETTDLPTSFEAGGVVRARATAVVASRVMAPVARVLVRAGDRVRRGEPLVTLDLQEVAANRTRAEAALASADEMARAAAAERQAAEAAVVLARATYTRIRTLEEKRSATPQELDQATAALRSAEAQLAGAQARADAAGSACQAANAALDAATIAASYGTLTAPFNGVVATRTVDPGSMASPGAPLLTVEDTSSFRLEVALDEARAGVVKVGDRADVELGDTSAAPSRRLTAARISEIARIDPASHSFLVKVDLPIDAAVGSGEFGRARFTGPSRHALTIPASSAVRRGQLTFVFAVDRTRRARLQPISPGDTVGDRLEVLAGVHEGDEVVVNPSARLADGALLGGDNR